MTALITHLDERGILTLTMARPDVHNAFDDALIADINTALQQHAPDTSIRCLILRSEGKSFSAGADLGWMRRMAQYSEAENVRDAEALENLMHQLHAFPAPTLALVQGAAFGGAVGLVSCCDIALGSDAASFCLSEARIGLAPAVISPYVIAAIGHRAASRYFLTAERFSARKALELGLLHEVVEADQLETRAGEIVTTLLENGPHAVRAAKALIQQVSPVFSEENRRYTTELIARIRVSAEGQEGLGAFLEKRTPAWKK